MGSEGAAAIVGLQLGAEGLVLLHHVEDVAQHLEHDAVGLCPDGGGARVEGHAGHLAEEVSGVELRDRVVVGQIDRSVDADVCGCCALAFADVLRLRPDAADHLFEKAVVLVFRRDVGAGSADEDVDVAFEDVESGRTIVAFADDHFAGFVHALDDGAGVELEEGSGDAFEDGQREEFLGLNRVSLVVDRGVAVGVFKEGLADDLLVGEGAGWAGDHALAAGDAGRVPHGLVGVEGDGGEVAFALSRDHIVVPNLGTAADAAIAEDAGGVVDVDGDGGVVGLHDGDGALLEAVGGGQDTGGGGLGFEFAVVALLLADAGRRVVRQHQLVEGVAHGLDGLGVGLDDHAGLGLEDAGGLQGALADVADADAADADGGLVLLVAEDGDGDAGDARGVEDGGAMGDGDFDVVDRQSHWSCVRRACVVVGHVRRSPRSRCRRCRRDPRCAASSARGSV